MVCKVQRPISIPEPTNEVDSLWRTTQVLKEAVEVIQGIRGNREYALKCDLDDINAAVTNISVISTPGEGSDLEFGGSQYDMLYNTDGTTWGNTGGQLQWNPNSKRLQLNNDIAISWLNSVATSVDFLAIDSDALIVGDPAYPINIESSSVNMLNAIPIKWKDSFNGDIEVLNFRSDEFLAGSVFYPTRLEGTLVGLRSGIGLNWETIDGADVELAVLNDLGSAPQSDYGTELANEWAYDSEVSTVALMTSTGIGVDFVSAWVMPWMDISSDGLHWVNGANNNDQINTYTLDTAFDPGVATSDLPAGWVYTNPSMMRFTGAGAYVTHGRLQRDSIIIKTLDSPYTISTGSGASEGLPLTTWSLEPEVCWMMTEDGNRVLLTAEKAGGIVWMQMYDTVTPYTLAGMTLATELNIDTRFPQSISVRRLQLSPDGLSIWMLYKEGEDRIFLWTLTSAFDVSTATADTVNMLSLDDGLNGVWYDFVLTTDVNTFYAVKGSDYSIHKWTRIAQLPPAGLGAEFIVGDPAYPTKIDGTVLELEALTRIDIPNNIGVNWDDESGTEVELLNFSGSAPISWPALSTFSTTGAGAVTELGHSDVVGMRFNGDGTRLYMVWDVGSSGVIYGTPNFSVPYVPDDITGDVTVKTDGSRLRDLAWNDDGTKMYAAVLNNALHEYDNTGTPFNPGNGELTEIADESASPQGPRSVEISADGTKIWYVSNASGRDIFEWNMPTPYDLSTKTVGNSFAPTEGDMVSMRMAPDGKRMFLMSLTTETLNDYTLSTAFDITSAVFVSSLDVSGNLNGAALHIDLSPDGLSMIVCGYSTTTANSEIQLWTSSEAAVSGQGFVVGDPAHDTRIDGTVLELEAVTRIDIPNAIGVNWDDSAGTPIELAFFEEVTGPTNDFGSDPSTDWADAGEVVDYTALVATGVLQDTTQPLTGIAIWSTSDDGLHTITGDAGNDRVRSYTLDAPYDYANATSNFPTGATFANPTFVQYVNEGGHYIVAGFNAGLFRYATTAAYVVGAASPSVTDSASLGDLGYITGANIAFYMSRDGSILLTCGAKTGDVTWLRMWDVGTPYDLSTLTLRNELNIEAQDGLSSPASARTIVMSDDGLSFYFMYKGAGDSLYLYEMTVAFDVSTATLSGSLFNFDTADNRDYSAYQLTTDASEIYITGRAGGTNFSSIRRLDRSGAPADGDLIGGFVVGDPVYPTRIDGLTTNITSAATDIDGTLNVDGAVALQSSLDVAGAATLSQKLNANTTTVITTSHTAADEHVILVDDDTAAATVTVTLPTAATANTIYHIKKMGSTALVIIDGDGTETIEGSLTATLTTQYESIMLVSDGSEWHVI